MTPIKLDGICKSYDDVEVVKDLHLDIPEGSFTVFLGPSGCGKSTTLRMIAGLEEITDGELRFNESRVNEQTPKERDVGMVFQNYALYPHMTVFENIGFSLKLQKKPKAFIADKVNAVAQMLEIDQLLQRKPAALSGGQCQRVAIGRALVREPKVLLFDEPLSNLDAALRVQMRHELSLLHQKIKSTIVYVTHDQVEAMTLATKIVVLHDGVLQQEGTPHEIYHQPANRFVAGFIGSPPMNLFEGDIVETPAGLQGRVGESFTFDLSSFANLQPQKVTFGVRTHEVQIGAEGIAGRLASREWHGEAMLLHYETEVGNLIVQRSAQDMEDIALGSEAYLGFQTERLYLFGAQGQRIGLAS